MLFPPDAEELLELERRARHQGSGLEASDLVGIWRLDQVWGKASRQPSALSGALLRGLGARLEIAAGNAAQSLRLTNAVNLGAVELRFEGEGELRGRRPLLRFWFERMQLRVASRVLWERALERPEPHRLPFFALIASSRRHRGEPGEAGGSAPDWLAARGRGGGLALWLASQGPPPAGPSRSSRS